MLHLRNPKNKIFIETTSGSSWSVSERHGTTGGVTARVSGKGATAKMKGRMSFEIRKLENSKTYHSLVSKYSISGGISAFFGWIKVNASTSKTEIDEVFNEVQTSLEINGYADFDLEVTGIYPNVPVTASAYVSVLEISDSSGNSFLIGSEGEPTGNTGAVDANGNNVPVKNNASTISL